MRSGNTSAFTRSGITDLPVDAQWIFLTGENGFGKTTVLQAIAVGMHGEQDGNRLLVDRSCQIGIELDVHGEAHINNLYRSDFQAINHLATYGAARLNIQSRDSKNAVVDKSTGTYSLFQTDGVLLSIEPLLLAWHTQKSEHFKTLKSALLTTLLYMQDIVIKKDDTTGLDDVFYYEKNPEEPGSAFDPVPFQQLASGPRSILAMVSDMYIRLQRQQQDVVDPADLYGLVLIDELELHLHPKWLRELPGLLSTVFPNVQFIASTHSVVPILGAPLRSVFLKVTRTHTDGVQLETVDINVKNLLPNTLLTSPLFDFEHLIPAANQSLSELRTEEDYQILEANDRVQQRLNDFEENDGDFPDDLFEP